MGILSKHSDGEWNAHAHKRVKLTLKEELARTGEETQLALFNSGRGKLTDITIRCGAQSWEAHRAILASRCDFFQACFAKDFKESQSKTMYLNEDSPEAIETFLEYLYTLSSEIVARSMQNRENAGEYLMSLAKVADKYDQPLLLEQICIVFEQGRLSPLKTADKAQALVALEEDTIGTSVWVKRIQESILEDLTNGGALMSIDDATLELFQDGRTLRRVLQAMSKKILMLRKDVDGLRKEPSVDSDESLYSNLDDHLEAMQDRRDSERNDRA